MLELSSVFDVCLRVKFLESVKYTIVVYEYCLLYLDGLFYMLAAIELNE